MQFMTLQERNLSLGKPHFINGNKYVYTFLQKKTLSFCPQYYEQTALCYEDCSPEHRAPMPYPQNMQKFKSLLENALQYSF